MQTDDCILFINEKPYHNGLSSLIELKFGEHFRVIQTDSYKLRNKVKSIPKLIIVEEIADVTTTNTIKEFKMNGSKVILLSLDVESIKEMEWSLYDGFLLKNMRTSEMLNVIQDVIDYPEVYVHPAVGSFFLEKLIGTK